MMSTGSKIRVLQAFMKMYSPVLNGEHFTEGVESANESTDIDYANNSEDESDDSDHSEEVDSPPHTEHRTKQTQDPVTSRGKAMVSSGRNPKRTRTPTPGPTEKTAKQAKVIPPKPRKALPRIKVTVPIAST